MTGKERITRILKRQRADRIGLFEHFWGDTHKAWTEKGSIPKDASFTDLFDYDMDTS